MASTFVISCPGCKNPIKASSALEGKKIRCKACSHTFVVKAASAIKAAPDAGKPAKRQTKPAVEEENANPYGVTDLDESRRCPHCAAPVEEDATICLECGYNFETREHIQTKKTLETTGGDVFMWLLPGILCVVAVLALIGIDIGLMVGHFNAEPNTKESILAKNFANCMFYWPIIASLFGFFYAGRFAIRRLILHPTPPEKVVRK